MTDIVDRLRETLGADTPARYPDIIRVGIGEIELLRAALEQIRTVCDDNAAPSCRHEMALAFVRQVANSVLPSAERTK
jgi:hypothetical protein